MIVLIYIALSRFGSQRCDAAWLFSFGIGSDDWWQEKVIISDCMETSLKFILYPAFYRKRMHLAVLTRGAFKALSPSGKSSPFRLRNKTPGAF